LSITSPVIEKLEKGGASVGAGARFCKEMGDIASGTILGGRHMDRS